VRRETETGNTLLAPRPGPSRQPPLPSRLSLIGCADQTVRVSSLIPIPPTHNHSSIILNTRPSNILGTLSGWKISYANGPHRNIEFEGTEVDARAKMLIYLIEKSPYRKIDKQTMGR
jgi:hypothetical protein